MNRNSAHDNWLYYLRRGITDLWFLLSVALAVIILIVLLGYHESDPGWSTSGTEEVRHWLGTPGAYAADALLSLFGYAAYLLPLSLLAIGWQSARRGQIDAEMMMWKLVSLLGGLPALAGIFSIHWPVAVNSVAITAGGLAGQKLSMWLLEILPMAGVMGIYTGVFFLSMTLLFAINWLWVAEKIGNVLLLLFHKASNSLDGKKKPAVDAQPLADGSTAGENRRQALRQRLDAEQPRNEPSMDLNWSSYKDEVQADTRLPLPEEPLPAPQEKVALTSRSRGLGNWFAQREQRQQEALHDRRDTTTADNDPFAGFDAFPVREDAEVGEPTINFSGFSLEDHDDDLPESFVDTSSVAEDTSFLNNLLEQRDPQPDQDVMPLEAENASAAPGMRVKLAPLATPHFPVHGRRDETYQLPPLSLLRTEPPAIVDYSDEELDMMAARVERALADYRLDVQVANIEVGPVITRLELELAPGIKVSQISNLDKDLARNLSVQSVRVVDVIPGKPYVGLEIPNRKRNTVYLRSILESSDYRESKAPLTVVLGRDIAGEPMVANLAKMPHVLVAGTTGSGKSVAINVMLASLLYKATPDELKLILIDPKMLEMSMYEDIPHLLTPVVTDMNDAENALRWAVEEMERRYQLMSAMRVRNIIGFNTALREAKARGEHVFDPLWRAEDHIGLANQPPEIKELPYIVIVIDELADMMMVVGKRVEELIARIAQKARAAGIHLILATQRPSVDVITGLIKANVPTRIAFQVSSKIDSRTIIDQQGAEALLGSGDMLYMPPGSSAPRRVHGAFMEDHEVDALTTFLKNQGEPNYEESITSPANTAGFGSNGSSDDPELDPLYDQAVALVVEHGKASISWLQRKLGIGYNRSARIIEAMEYAGIVSGLDRGQRKVLVPRGENSDEDY